MLDGALKPIEVLLVEDNAGDVRLTEEAFKEGKLAVNLSVARDGLEATEMLHQRNGHGHSHRPDLILLDLNLPKKERGSNERVSLSGDNAVLICHRS